ncbi:MAG: hypothetical protein KH050_03630 [Clostridiaceae bacterium]|nr:hypothetical protein [Clostridiaceae bacterium]
MFVNQDQLLELRRQTARKQRLKAVQKELRAQCDALSTRVQMLEKIKLEEQNDVERLEGHSLAAFFYGVIGKMDERLDKERAEAYAARVKYDTAAHELAAAERDLAQCEVELAQLHDCEAQYDALLQAKAQAVKQSGGAEADEILRAEYRLAQIEGKKQEIQEAIAAGQSAHAAAEQVLSCLNSAQDWGTWDMLGGGLLTDLIKYEHLDSAQQQIGQLQSALRRFKTELADVTIQAEVQVGVDGFLRFADYFFDNLFTDWAVMDQIGRSKAQVHDASTQIEEVLARLNEMLHDLEREHANEQSELNALIVQIV